MAKEQGERGEGAGRVWVGIDLGGTKMLVRVYDDAFKGLAGGKKKTRGRDGADATVARMIEMVREGLGEAGVDPARVAGIGVGCPGPLDLETGVLLELPNLGWREVPIKRALEAAFGCPVSVLNDVDAGVFGEYAFGAARGARCALGVFPGTGIGGGCVYEGRLLRGRTRSCLELGHVQVVPNGALCGCGRRGCLETVASRLAVAAAAAAAAYRGEAPHLLQLAGMNLSRIRSGLLAEAMAAGDDRVRQIVEQAAEWLGVGVAGAVNLLAPDVVVLGGGLVEALGASYVKTVCAALDARVMPAFAGTYTVKAAALGDEAVVQGAAAWAREAQA
jgi:glucokinase